MNRPARLRAHLLEKIARKQSRNPGKKLGKKAKAWTKAAEQYKAVAEGTVGTPDAVATTPAAAS